MAHPKTAPEYLYTWWKGDGVIARTKTLDEMVSLMRTTGYVMPHEMKMREALAFGTKFTYAMQIFTVEKTTLN